MRKHENQTRSDQQQPLADSSRVSQQTVHHELVPTRPGIAIKRYLQDITHRCARKTVQSHNSRLTPLRHWCGEVAGIENLNELTGHDLQQFRRWRRDDGDLKPVSVKSQMHTLRVFIRWCEREGIVSAELHEKVYVPAIGSGEDARDTIISGKDVSKALEWLRKYCYASIQHCVWEVLADTGMRMGALRALDIEDYCTDDYPYVQLTHREETGTPLKNGAKGERYVHLSEPVGEVLDDFLDEMRPDVTDDYGRAPLLATKHGRIAPSTVRNYVYMLTRPCAVGDDCPHNEPLSDCAAAQRNNQSSKCPSSKSPHAMRRGVISHELRTGVPVPTICQRCNVTEPVLRKHYDQLEEDERMAVRKDRMDTIHEQEGRYGE